MAAHPVQILYVHHRPELGGAPQSLAYLLRSLDRGRFEPHVFCPPGPAAELFREAGAEVHTGAMAGFTHIWASTYRGRRWLLLGREALHLPRHLADLHDVLTRRRFSLVHLNDSPLIPAAAVAKRANVPIVWHLRSALPGDGFRTRAVRRAVSRYSAATIAINEDVARSFDVDAAVVPNAVDLDSFRPGDAVAARRRLGLPAGRPAISFFGFMYPSKGFADFIEAAALLTRKRVDATFLIVGGSVRDEAFFRSPFGRGLQSFGFVRDYSRLADELVRSLGLDGRVSFVPFTRDIVSLYQASDIVVAPSRGPELGRPVLEAAACGRPVVASGSLSGAGILIPGRTGCLVPRRSPHMIALALESLIADEPLREALGTNARRHAEEAFSAERSAERVMQIYEEVLRRS